MYTFRARIVDSFQAGRCILAGDSAHLTRACAYVLARGRYTSLLDF